MSAKDKLGFEELFASISEKLFGEEKCYKIPLSESHLVQKVREKGILLSESWEDGHVIIEARLPETEKAAFKKYLLQKCKGAENEV